MNDLTKLTDGHLLMDLWRKQSGGHAIYDELKRRLTAAERVREAAVELLPYLDDAAAVKLREALGAKP